MKAKIYDEKAEVLSLTEVAREVYRCKLLSPSIAQSAVPFQFVNVCGWTGTDPFLRRPFSLSNICKDSGTVEITFAVVGKGTKLMSAWKPGQAVCLLGPLGNGLQAKNLRGTIVMIAGGMGLAPMAPFAREAASGGLSPVLVYGVRTASLALSTQPFTEVGCPVIQVSDDGSLGLKGTTLDGLSLWFEKRKEKGPVTGVSCGPKAMLRAVKQLFEGKGLPLYVSLEERMACGTGLCQGCSVKAADKPGYYRVCTDGPVFPARAVNFEGGDDA